MGAWEDIVERIGWRRWPNIKNQWQAHSFSAVSAANPPIQTLGELPGAAAAVSELTADEALVRIEGRIAGAETTIIHEGVFLLHKAVHVLGAAERHAATGTLTWSLSSGYHASFFAARAITRFLGIGTFEAERLTYVVDVSGRKDRKDRNCGVLALRSGRPSHVDQWRLFAQAVRSCVRLPWIDEVSRFCREFDVGAINLQRNEIHYLASAWTFSDLYNEGLYVDTFARRESLAEHIEAIQGQDDESSLVAGALFTAIAIVLFADLCELVGRLKPELDLLLGSLSVARHPVYEDFLRSLDSIRRSEVIDSRRLDLTIDKSKFFEG